MNVAPWPNRKIREDFFAELKVLLDKYPHLGAMDIREVDDEDDIDEGYPAFDPNSPMILQGVVLVLSYSNLEHYENIQILTPFEQSYYMSCGLLTRADTLMGGL